MWRIVEIDVIQSHDYKVANNSSVLIPEYLIISRITFSQISKLDSVTKYDVNLKTMKTYI